MTLPLTPARARPGVPRTCRLARPLALVLVAFFGAAPAPAAAPAIRISNYQDGITVRHPVPLLRGTLADKNARSLVVVNTSSRRPTREMKGLVHQGRFLALTELVAGANRLVFRAGKRERTFTLTYRPQTNRYLVRIIYMTDSTGGTTYQTPLAKDPQDYAAKLDTAMKLLQTFTAERMNDLGHGRCTFNLEFDAGGKVKVHTLKGKHPAKFYYQLPDQAWWQHVYGWSDGLLPMARGKNIVIAAYTRFDPEARKVRGHTALGGGGLALFGSGGLFSWPSRLNDVFAAFQDARPVDGTRIHDDSAGRGTFWGLASTTLGATLHELGHTFGLPHSKDPLDIMTRGFDHFNRAFAFADPPSRHHPKRLEFTDRQVAYFAPISAAALRASPWFSLDARPRPDGNGPQIVLDPDAGTLRVTAKHGLRYLGIDDHGDAVDFRSFWGTAPPPRRLTLSLDEVEKKAPGGAIRLRIWDAEGNQATAETSGRARALEFVRAWHFSKLTQPWPNKSVFVPVDAKKLGAIEASALAAKRLTSKEPFVDFLPRFPERTQDVAAYVVRTVQVRQARKVKILAGSDDALRVWLNGKQVIAALALRPARPDENSAVVALRPGKNKLTVEVSQASGGWGLYLRLEDDKGRKLGLTDDDQLRQLSTR